MFMDADQSFLHVFDKPGPHPGGQMPCEATRSCGRTTRGMEVEPRDCCRNWLWPGVIAS